MNLNVTSNTITKRSGTSNIYTCDWIFTLSCTCHNCMEDRFLTSPGIADAITSINCRFQIQLISPSVFKIRNASPEFDNFTLKLHIKNKKGSNCYNREYSYLGRFLSKNYLNDQNQMENEYTLKFLNISDIQNCNYIVNGKLTIGIEIIKNMVFNPIAHAVFNLQSDMKNLQLNEKISDVTLVVGDQMFHVHKAILASRSPVFLAMFNNEMKEKIEGKVVIENVSEQAMKQVLNYIYTEMVDEGIFKDVACEVLPVAHRYDIKGLIDICEVTLLETLDINNAFKLLLAADSYKLALLKNAAINFVATNAKDLVETDDFKNYISSTNQDWLRDIVLAFG